MATVKSGPKRSDIRAWLNDNGHTQGARGRFTPAGVAAWNAAHPFARYNANTPAHVHTVTVSVKPAKGRTITRKVSPIEVRAAAKAAGHDVGQIGRLKQSTFEAFVLGTLVPSTVSV